MARPKPATTRAHALMVRVDQSTKDKLQALATKHERSIDFILREIISSHFAKEAVKL